MTSNPVAVVTSGSRGDEATTDPAKASETSGKDAVGGGPEPGTGEVPEGGPRLVLVNPKDSGGPVNYLLDGKSSTSEPGTTQTLSGQPTWQVEFDRGEASGQARYTLTEGTYTFTVTEKGWELYRTKFDVTLDNSSNPNDFHYVQGDLAEEVRAGRTQTLRGKFAISSVSTRVTAASRRSGPSTLGFTGSISIPRRTASTSCRLGRRPRTIDPCPTSRANRGSWGARPRFPASECGSASGAGASASSVADRPDSEGSARAAMRLMMGGLKGRRRGPAGLAGREEFKGRIPVEGTTRRPVHVLGHQDQEDEDRDDHPNGPVEPGETRRAARFRGRRTGARDRRPGADDQRGEAGHVSSLVTDPLEERPRESDRPLGWRRRPAPRVGEDEAE